MAAISIYVSYHNKCDLIQNTIFKPIQVGAALNTIHYPDQLNDATGDNISLKNKSFCELTAQYWAWKNDQTSDYIGFYHYRRHLVINPNHGKTENQYGVLDYDRIDQDYLNDIGYYNNELNHLLKDMDIIIPEKWDVRQHYAKNNLDQYKRGPYLDIQDYYECLAILQQKYPEYTQAIQKYNTSYYGYYTNMFIMKRSIFLHYSQWLFSILFELEKKISLEHRNLQEYRVFGYLSEWLLGIYITKQLEDKSLKIAAYPRSFIHNTKTGQFNLSSSTNPSAIEQDNLKKIPESYKKIVPIVTAFNEKYAISGAALLQSIIANSDPNCFYDIYIIEGELSEETKYNFNFILRNLKNFRLTITNVDHYFQNKELGLHSHFSKETYYRILIPQLLPYYNKVIYLDADLIVNKDIQNLFDIDIQDKSLAAIRDYVMAGFVKNEIRSRGECESLTAGEYLTKYLGMQDPANYIQAGVLILNLKKMRDTQIDIAILNDMGKKPYWFLDQDLLNKHLENDIHYLDLKWNVLHGNGNVDIFFRKLPLSIMEAYFTARKDPWIIHFAGEKKPWIYPSIDFANLFFFYLKDTPWGVNLQGYSRQDNIICFNKANLNIREILKPFINRFLPIGSTQRKFLGKTYLLLAKKL